MPDTAALVVALSAQLTKFEKDMDQAYAIADNGVKKIEQRFSQTNIHIGGFEDLIDGFKKVAAGAGLAEVIKQVVELNKGVAEIGESAARVGSSTDDFQKLRFAFVATGSSLETANGFLDTFSRKVTEAATGTGALYNFLKTNNIEASTFAKLPINDQVARYADLVKNTAVENRNFVSSLVSSRQAAASVTDALKEGADGLKEYGDQAEQTGVILDKELIERAKIANQQFQILKLQTTTLLQEAAVAIIQQSKKMGSEYDAIGNQIGTALKSGWDQFYYAVKDTFPELVAFVKSGIADMGQQLSDAAKLRAGADRSSNFATGVELLKRGMGTSTGTIPGMEKFPGYQPPKDDTARQTQLYNEQAAAFQKLIDQQTKRTEVMRAEADTVGQSVAVQTTYKTAIELENAALEKNKTISAEQYAVIQQTARAAGDAAQAVDNARRAWAGLNSAVQFAGDQLINVLEGLTNKTMTFQQAVKSLESALIKALLQSALLGSGPLANIMGLQTSIPGGTGGLFGGLTGLFSGKQSGGPVSAGTPYIVGEHGPELFVPRSGGTIVPNQIQQRGGSGATTVQINNYTSGETETKQRQTGGPDGDRIIVDIVKKAQARGDFDDVNRSRFGLRPNKVR